jgi:DNA replication protein DnaD
MNRGFVKIFRCIEDNVLWRSNEPYCRRAAWIDLIFLVNHEDKEFIMGNQKMIVRRGQRWTSIIKLAQRWGWSEKKVRAYLNLLKAEGMIYLETTNKGTLITLVNYGKFQDFGTKREGQKTGQKEGQKTNEGRTEDRAKGRQTRTIKNDIKNELKNEKKPAAQSGFFVED